jgi:hypothetical protein
MDGRARPNDGVAADLDKGLNERLFAEVLDAVRSGATSPGTEKLATVYPFASAAAAAGRCWFTF